MRRRMLMDTLGNSGLFTYVRDYTFSNTYGKINIEIDVDDNSVYLLIPKNKEIINTVFVVVSTRNGKCGFAYCNEDTQNGLASGNNYSISDGKVTVLINGTNNGIYDVTYEMYKMNQT